MSNNGIRYRDMKKIITVLLLIMSMASACTKQTVIDSGVCSPYHDCSIMDYLRKSEYEWGFTVQLIERAGLTDLFEGRVDSLPEITFLGIPSMSVERYLYDRNLESVQDISAEECRLMVLQHVAKGKILRNDVEFRNMEYTINAPEQTGGTDVKMLFGNVIRFYREHSDYKDVPNAGAVTLSLWTLGRDQQVPMSSSDIQPLNGVVHALNYNYVLDLFL